jgi:uncharacterized protein (DUF342 family)
MAEPQDHSPGRGPNKAAEDGTPDDFEQKQDQAAVRDSDARVEFTFSEDLMWVRAEAIHPPTGDGRPLSKELLRERLVQEGVSHGVRDEAVAALVETFRQSGTCDSELALAEGDPPEDGRPGRIEIIQDSDIAAALPGDVFARLIPTQQPRAGKDITGAPVAATADSLPEVHIQAGEHCRLGDGELEAIATSYGKPQVEDERAFVRPGVRVVEGGLACMLDVFPLRINGEAVEESDLIEALEAVGVQRDMMDLDAIHDAWEAAQTTRTPQLNVLAARGIEPQPGRDGEILFTVDIEERVGTLDERGRIDFKEQNRLHRVHKDDQIAVLVANTMGKPGLGVAGQEIPARPGKPVELNLGQGAREEDGGIFANFGGALISQGTTIDVSNSFRVSGDVDYHSGNISNDSGSVYIEGSLLAGFRVSAGGDVEIGRSIEGGTIEAGGELIVREAIIGKEGATVRAVKDIRAAYVQNADLTCDGNLMIERELIQSNVRVTGMLKLTGRPGAIVGGEIEADGGIVTTTLGSASGAPTIVRIGRGTRRISLLSNALNEKLEPLKRIRARLGTSSVDELIDRLCGLIETAEAEYEEVPTPALSDQLTRLKERRASVRKLLRLHKELEAECAELETELAEAEKEREKQVTNGTPACVEVRGTVYPGVVFMIDGATFPVTKKYSGVRFFYNTIKRRVEARRNF